MNSRLIEEYAALYREVLQPIAARLEAILKDHLQDMPHIDRVAARAKSPERFIAKALAKKPDGSLRYSAPLSQIQDQLGARIIVLYAGDVDPSSQRILQYFRHIEERTIVPESEWAFGYFGRHYVLALPTDVVPLEIELASAPRFFELQIKTLFQHAWSEANHDLGYKPREELSDDQKRRLAFTAAQAWGADRVFQELVEELLPSHPEAA